MLGLDGSRPRQWESDMIEIHQLRRLAERKEQFEMMALLLGKTLGKDG